MRRAGWFGELLVTCLIFAVAYAVCKPWVDQFKWMLRYDHEISRMHNLFGTCSMYAGQNDDRFPSSISEYDRYLMSVSRTPTDEIAMGYWGLPGSCQVLAEFSGKDALCMSNNDSVPKFAQPNDKNFISWKAMTGSAYDTSSRFGIFHVALSSTWNCPSMPMFWTHPYEDTGDDPTRVTYFEGETKLVDAEELASEIVCIKAHLSGPQ